MESAAYDRANKNHNFAVKINSMKLIRLVRANEVLYNSNADGYNDKGSKDLIWERIYRALFPAYDKYKPSVQDVIRVNVRRRWKTLRDSVSREVKRSVTVENYARKKESPIISELEFLIPHIRSTHCAKLADELGLRECYSSVKDTDTTPQDEDSLNDLIDLTEECDIKPFIKQDGFQYDEMDNGDESFPHAPQVDIDVGEAIINGLESTQTAQPDDSMNSTWNKEYCTVAEFKGGEFINPVEEDGVDYMTVDARGDKSPVEPNGKHVRSMTEEPNHELQAKILQLLSSIENRERNEIEAHDEDRMFLLSLVSDLKRVPASKKMRIKMEIVTAIARANQCQ